MHSRKGAAVSARSGDFAAGGLSMAEVVLRDVTKIFPPNVVAVKQFSLTIADLGKDRFTVSVIPHTLEHTTFRHLKNESRVNLEMDFFAKYIERLCARRDADKPKPEWID